MIKNLIFNSREKFELTQRCVTILDEKVKLSKAELFHAVIECGYIFKDENNVIIGLVKIECPTKTFYFEQSGNHLNQIDISDNQYQEKIKNMKQKYPILSSRELINEEGDLNGF